jgi:uncharacterized membrane protein
VVWRRVLTVVCGAVLIVLGFADYHVQVGAIVVGLVLVGAVSVDQLVRLIEAARREPRSGPPPAADP